MYLTYKDHKGWSGEDGSPPPTRPIAGGNTGMNLHISEALSEMIEPIVDAHKGNNEVISTEDFKARMEEINQSNEGWSRWKWWDGKTSLDGGIICCGKCTMDEGTPPAPAGSYGEEGNTVSSDDKKWYEVVIDEECVRVYEADLCECEAVKYDVDK